ncbi:hypothetical protein FMM01_03160 [Schleiferilactobacillus harbinensis]|uniref:hypothetical protein n=1 Tax=Schleiferilactobacillus harbinensis TaxID=304207 RepID=UPI0012397AF9|nr:hypothetical protein [Schleiferilactobacillus harbinensis]QEU46358.1 hypothetical protein FMM01_03160 [Schleiferilactobacillus harbinensis]
MTKKSLWQLLLRRHRVWLILIAVFFIFFGVLQGASTVSVFNSESTHPYTEKEYDKHVWPYLPKSQRNQTYQQYNDKMRTQTFGAANHTQTSQSQPFFNFFAFLVMIVLGCIATFWDQLSGFNRLLFSSGARRRDILWTKSLLYLAVSIPAYFVSIGVSLAIIGSNIPHEFLVFHWPSILINMPAFLLQLIAGFAAGSLFGIVIGQTLPLVLTVAFLGLSVTQIISQVVNRLDVQASFWQILGLVSVNYVIWFGCIVVFAGLSFYFYSRLSLESSHHYLLFPQLRWPVLIAFTIYIPFFFQDWLFTGHQVISMVITAIIVFAFFYWYLFRPRRFMKRLSRPANHSQTPAP